MIEKTLVLVKPDGVERGLVGEIISRFERRGIKIIGIKMVRVNKELAMKHYTEDITKRRGEHVRKRLMDFIVNNHVIAICLEGVDAVENVRKIVGETEPRAALPGTIRGDYSHISYKYADNKKIVVPNLVHASANKEEAEKEISLWFSQEELFSYKSVHDKHVI
ncbi:nucleoside-diphosphate kinase [Candidatus Woesearchaeota archaeon]|nr:nucleoside-diphosphate kinase [Candidatus Woesearchaeota archaeon]